MNDRRTCGGCRFWQRDEPEDQNGQCRRYPPARHAYRHVGPTMAEDNYCGEWRDKSVTPEQEQRAELMTRFALAIVQCESDTGAELVWQQAEQIVDAMPRIGGEA